MVKNDYLCDMKKSTRLLSLLMVILMMAGAAITVNKKIFGHGIEMENSVEEKSAAETDTVSLLPDGDILIHTAGMKGTTPGYAGAVPLDIRISGGKIAEITPLPNAESPSFFNRAAELRARWIGKTPTEALDIRPDAVSGATYSSNAILSNVRAGLEYYLGQQEKQHTEIPAKVWVAFAVTLAACILPLCFRNRVYHYIQLGANIIVLGFWCGQFLDYTLMLRYLSSGFVFPAALTAIVMLIAAFIYPLFGHPQHYCNHICPLGSAQQLVADICRYKIRISPRVLKGLDWFRKILWALLMLALWTDTFTSWMDMELFQAFSFESAPWWIIGAAILFIALSAVVARPYCRFVCPTGSLFKRAENIG